jgi:predicted RND superfamily exporter protein
MLTNIHVDARRRKEEPNPAQGLLNFGGNKKEKLPDKSTALAVVPKKSQSLSITPKKTQENAMNVKKKLVTILAQFPKSKEDLKVWLKKNPKVIKETETMLDKLEENAESQDQIDLVNKCRKRLIGVKKMAKELKAEKAKAAISQDAGQQKKVEGLQKNLNDNLNHLQKDINDATKAAEKAKTEIEKATKNGKSPETSALVKVGIFLGSALRWAVAIALSAMAIKTAVSAINNTANK